MKYQILLAAALTLVVSAFAQADGIPSDAKTNLELDCVAQLTGGSYSGVQSVVIKDVLYKTPPAPWDNNNSEAIITLADGSTLTGVMNESNGNDPQDYRDSAPTEYSGYGGMGMYAIPQAGGKPLVFITRSASNQRNLPARTYSVMFGIYDESGIKNPTTGELNCTKKQ